MFPSAFSSKIKKSAPRSDIRAQHANSIMDRPKIGRTKYSVAYILAEELFPVSFNIIFKT